MNMTETFEEQFPSFEGDSRWCTFYIEGFESTSAWSEEAIIEKCLDKQLIFKLNQQDLEQCSLMLGLSEKELRNQIKTNPIACAVFNIHLQYLKKVKETIYLSLNQGKTTEAIKFILKELGLEEE